jgi:hypothetical protein
VGAGCGGGGEEPQRASATSPTAHASTPATSYQPGPAPAPAGGAFGPFSSGGSMGGGGAPRLGGLAGSLHDRVVRQREAIERAHRGPERLSGQSADDQRHSDFRTAYSSARAVPQPGDDDCDRLWARHAAGAEAFHALRHDGLHSATGPGAEQTFLTGCRGASPEERQCMDADYLIQHQDECATVRQAQSAATRRRIPGARTATAVTPRTP